MSTAPIRQRTPEHYLEIERKAAFKSEFYRDEMLAGWSARRTVQS